MKIRAAASSAVALTVLGLAGAVAPVEHAEASHGCWNRPSVTVVRSTEARVFQKRVRLSGRETDGAPGYRMVDYGCHYRKRATYRLAQQGEFGIAGVERAPLALSGKFAAYVQRFASAAGGDNVEVTVCDLVTGRVARRFSGSESNFDSSLQVLDLVVKRNASTAWTSEERLQGPDGSVDRVEYQVHAVDTSGRRRIVDRGPGIDPRSLELASDRRSFAYVEDGERRSVPLD